MGVSRGSRRTSSKERLNMIDKTTFVVYRDEPTSVNKLGVTQNRIVEIPNFVDRDTASKMIDFFEARSDLWGDVAFYKSSGMGIAPEDPNIEKVGLPPRFFETLTKRFQEAVGEVFSRPVKPNTSHAQKWEVGGFASPHSDNSDFDGNPTLFEINKYVGILYLNDDYEGGNLFFTKTDNINEKTLTITPKAGSYIIFPGGIENIHGVEEVTAGTRYTMVSFWDFAEAEYSEERQAEWAAERERVEAEKAAAREEWAKGNKWA